MNADLLIHAAELLESEARSLRQCHTVGVDWFVEEDLDARVAYVDMMATARRLRELAAEAKNDNLEWLNQAFNEGDGVYRP